MKKIIVVTGGAGFVGSNLIELLIEKTNYKILSIDNYSSGSKKNHIKNSRIKTGDTFRRRNRRSLPKCLCGSREAPSAQSVPSEHAKNAKAWDQQSFEYSEHLTPKPSKRDPRFITEPISGKRTAGRR